MKSRDEIPTLEILKAKLKEEEARQNDRDAKTCDSDQKSDALLARGSANRGRQLRINLRENLKDGSTKASTQKFYGKCFNCEKIGHKSCDCLAKQKQNKSTDNALTAIACNAELTTKSGVWCLDSGTTRHMCNNKQKFDNISKDDHSQVYTAGEQSIKSIGSGNINL